MTTRLRPVVKVTRQASGKTWAVTLWEPRQDGRVHELAKVLGDGFESRKLAEQHAKWCRGGKGLPVSAIGKVMGLDAGGLKDPNHEYPGSVVVHITCTLEQSRAWAELWGRDVQALPVIPPAEAAAPEPQLSLNLAQEPTSPATGSTETKD